MPVTVHRLPDADAVAEHVARDTVATVAAGVAAAGAVHVCLTGGTTPLAAYSMLDGLLEDWTGANLWYGDERCVPFDDPQSNHHEVHERFAAAGADWHPMPGPHGPDLGAAHYAEELGDTTFDLLHLGIGPDGHIASLFPGHRLLDADGVTAGLDDSPKPPPERITILLPRLNASARIVLLASGEAKAQALAAALGPPSHDTPASLLDRDRLEVVADEAALSQVPA